MSKIIIQNEFYTIKDCIHNPQNLYVFGDNLMRIGTGGQAIIRNIKNSYGIATKKTPSMDKDAFFSDKDSFNPIEDDIIELSNIVLSNTYESIIFPAAGLGTGLSKMPEMAPKLFEELCDILSSFFDIQMTENGF